MNGTRRCQTCSLCLIGLMAVIGPGPASFSFNSELPPRNWRCAWSRATQALLTTASLKRSAKDIGHACGGEIAVIVHSEPSSSHISKNGWKGGCPNRSIEHERHAAPSAPQADHHTTNLRVGVRIVRARQFSYSRKMSLETFGTRRNSPAFRQAGAPKFQTAQSEKINYPSARGSRLVSVTLSP